MKFLKDINKRTLIICNNDKKIKILNYIKENKMLLNINFMTIETLEKQLLFDYDVNTIYYLMNTYNYKYDVCLMYLNNLLKIEDKQYKNSKLNKLVELKKELDSNKLLIYNELFANYLQNINVIVYGYDYLTKYQEKLLDNIKTITNVLIIAKENNNYKHDVYEFNTLEEEIEFVAIRISELLEKNISINKIKICNISDDYNNSIKKIFKFYNIPINLNDNISLYVTEIGKFFLDNLQENIENTIQLLKQKFPNEEENINKIVNICNKYVDFNNFLLIKEILVNELKNNYVNKIKYKNAVELDDINNNFDDEYIFLMNFQKKSIPIIIKDEQYITDNICDEINFDKTYEINKLIKEATILNIKNIKNLIITYKLKDIKANYYPSNLVKEMNLNVLKSDINNHMIYSKEYKKLELAKKMDNLLKYGIEDSNLGILYYNFNDDKYLSYNNKFDGIDKEIFYEFIDKKLTLSYSSMENYNECGFKYYVNNILKLNPFENTFYTLIGNIFHHILEIGLFEEIDVFKEVKNYIKDKALTNKEKFFLEKLTEELIIILDIIKNQSKNIRLDNYLFEQEISINKGNNINVTFKGFVDKIIYKEDIKKVAVLIDYKTGNPDICLNYVPYGLRMQLPIYLYLVNKKISNVSFAGFYLQKILNGDIVIGNKSLQEQKENNLKLQGYSNSNIHILSSFDKSYEDSNLVAGLKVKQDGELYSSAKVLNDEQINKLILLTEEQIDNCISKLEEADFKINPKKIGYGSSSFNSCTFCTFKDICFKKSADYEMKEEIKDLSFLNGSEKNV